MNLKKIIILTHFLLAILFFSTKIAHAGPELLMLTSDKNELSTDDAVSVEAIFNNIFKSEFKGELSIFFEDFKKRSTPNVSITKLSVPPGKSSSKIKREKIIIKSDPEGLWRAIAEVRDNSGTLIARAEKNFFVLGTQKESKVLVKSCEDKECIVPKSVFSRDDIVFLRLYANITDYALTASLNDSQGKKIKDIAFKDGLAEISGLDIGSYIASVGIKKDGYTDTDVQMDFAIISQTGGALACNQNGQCDDGESAQDCPQDCPTMNPAGRKLLIAIALLVSSALMLSLTLFWLRHRKKTIEPPLQ